jgi:hypothetical protein
LITARSALVFGFGFGLDLAFVSVFIFVSVFAFAFVDLAAAITHLPFHRPSHPTTSQRPRFSAAKGAESTWSGRLI